ncbi:MAG: amidohydrolase [Nocardioidaceae bacterium]|nr:amidohydrolase [Nocardioidaceae bacterium]
MTDLLLTGARFLTMDPRRPVARAVSITGDRVVAVHDEPSPDVRADRVVDLDGSTVVPGLSDAHNHMAWFGMNLLEVDLGTPPVHDLDDVYAAVAERAATLAPGAWVVGSGYDQNKLGGHPDRDRLDAVAGGRPVWLKHTSGHMCQVNSAVLDRLGLADAGRDVPGGAVVVDASGRPTGLLQERAQSLVSDLVLPHRLDDLVDAVERAGLRYLSEGLTSVTEAGIGGGWIGRSPVELDAYQRAREQGRLPVRVELMVAHDALHPLPAHADDHLRLGLDLGVRTGLGDDWLRIGPAKVFSDGSLIGRTSAMCDDFADLPGERGFLQDDADALHRRIVDLHVSGWRVAAHAIGDAAIDLVLGAYAEAQRVLPRADVRHRIEHFGIARDDQVARAAELGVVPVPQGRFVNEIGDGMVTALGPDRVPWAYRARSILDAGLCLPGSSDRPVVDGAPLLGVHDLVNRRTSSGAPFAPHEALTAHEALHAFTMGSAWAGHRERTSGSLTPGKVADLTVLDADPTAVDPDTIAGIGVRATYVGGRLAFERGPS